MTGEVVRLPSTPGRFVADSLLEEAGFEPWVPVTKRGSLSRSETVTEAIKAGFAPVVGWGEPLRRPTPKLGSQWTRRRRKPDSNRRYRTASHDQGLESD